MGRGLITPVRINYAQMKLIKSSSIINVYRDFCKANCECISRAVGNNLGDDSSRPFGILWLILWKTLIAVHCEISK